MNIIMNYDYAHSIVLSQGWDVFFNMIKEQYREFSLYTCSVAWFDSDEYICKFRGTRGDLIIEWKHRKVS